MRWSRLFWAIVLLGVGSLLLLNNLGILDVDFGILLAIFLIILGIFTLLVRRQSYEGSEKNVSISRQGVKSARLDFEHAAGQLKLSSGSDPGEIISGIARGGIILQNNYTQDLLVARLSTTGSDFFHWALPWNWGESRTWDMRLTAEIPIDLHIKSGASEHLLNFVDLQLRKLHIETGASSTEVTLPAQAGMTHVKVQSGAASVNITVPDGVAARIETQALAAGININPQRFPLHGDAYMTPDYADAPNKVDIRIETGAASVIIQ